MRSARCAFEERHPREREEPSFLEWRLGENPLNKKNNGFS